MKLFKNDKWQSAEIYKILGVNLYLVKSNDKIYKRHANQLTDNSEVGNSLASYKGCNAEDTTKCQPNLR